MTDTEFHNIIVATIGAAMDKAMEPIPPGLDWKDAAAVSAFFSGWARKYADAQCKLHAAKLTRG